MPIPKHYPLETFDPRLKQLLLKAAIEEVTIPCESVTQAHRLQISLYAFRKAVKDRFHDQPDEWKPLYNAAVSIQKDKNGRKTIVRLYSRQHEFDNVLSKLDGASPQTQPEVDSTEDSLLKDLYKES